MSGARSASISGRRPASARPTPCSTRDGGARSGAPTWSIGWVQDHGRPHTDAQIRDLEVFPRRTVEYRGQTFEEMDIGRAAGPRSRTLVLVDELAHSNVPGSKHAKRWQDVEELLDAGINVISTSICSTWSRSTTWSGGSPGSSQQETVPDPFVRAADQIELVDMAPEALRRRLAHGNIYPPERIDTALANYFRPGNLIALRELALLWVADRVDEELTDYRERHNIAGPWETRERVVVSVTGSKGSAELIRRAARMAMRTKAELHRRPRPHRRHPDRSGSEGLVGQPGPPRRPRRALRRGGRGRRGRRAGQRGPEPRTPPSWSWERPTAAGSTSSCGGR